jgi:hypothetical protein
VARQAKIAEELTKAVIAGAKTRSYVALKDRMPARISDHTLDWASRAKKLDPFADPGLSIPLHIGQNCEQPVQLRPRYRSITRAGP